MPVTGTNDFYLRKEIALPVAYEKMEPLLFALDWIQPVPEPDAFFMYRYNDTSVTGDAKREEPAAHRVGGNMPEINFSRPLTASELMKMDGFSVRLPRQVIRAGAGGNEIMRCYENAGVWLAYWLNTKILTTLVAGATTPTWTPTVWSEEATANPVEDLRLLKYQMRREGYPFRLTDTIVNIENFGELEGYLTAMDINSVKQERIFGMPGGNGDSIYVPIAGCNVIGVDSGISEGGLLALDKVNPGAEFHYCVDSKFGTANISYNTMVDGKKTRKDVKNFGIHYDTYEEPDTKDTILQFWIEGKTVITNAYAYLYDTGI